MAWAEINEQMISLIELKQRWGITHAKLIEIITSNINKVDGSCKLCPFIQKETPHGVFIYKPILSVTDKRLGQLFAFGNPFLIKEKASIVFLLSQVEALHFKATTQTDNTATGSKRNTVRITATRQACGRIRSDIEQEKQIFDSDRNSWTPSLLFDNGKSNWSSFHAAVEKELGSKPHNGTTREEWNKIPKHFKHMGRVREQ